MDLKDLERFFSTQRLERFLKATKYSDIHTQILFDANIRISQSFYPLLHLFEVIFRNVCYENVSKYFRDNDWIINQKDGFMNHYSLAQSNFFLRNCIIKAENIQRNMKPKISSGKIISEQPFGFWTSLFEIYHYKLIGGSVIKAFPFKPKEIDRKILNSKLKSVRNFRNRVYHNEPICFDKQDVSITLCLNTYLDILELIQWIDPNLINYLEKFDTIKDEIKKLELLINSIKS
jgi:hypothetical protein